MVHLWHGPAAHLPQHRMLFRFQHFSRTTDIAIVIQRTGGRVAHETVPYTGLSYSVSVAAIKADAVGRPRARIDSVSICQQWKVREMQRQM